MSNDFVLPPINQKMNQGKFRELINDMDGFNKVNLEIDVSCTLSEHDQNVISMNHGRRTYGPKD